MKRSPMPPRKTELARTKLARSTKPMRRRSKKRAAEDRATNDIADFVGEFRACFRCGLRDVLEVDHLFGRSHAKRHHRTNLLLLCPACHRLKHANTLPLGYWLGLKVWQDWDGVDIDLLRELRAAKGGRLDIG